MCCGLTVILSLCPSERSLTTSEDFAERVPLLLPTPCAILVQEQFLPWPDPHWRSATVTPAHCEIKRGEDCTEVTVWTATSLLVTLSTWSNNRGSSLTRL